LIFCADRGGAVAPHAVSVKARGGDENRISQSHSLKAARLAI